ncbi:uncharacterized protein E5676_scaffold93G00260 [Cucumis melo var. makuwa]|uniref:Uncharacterized protein n=1 Tax=Cucumis melo var. makuwa TaxID=1194695 RepID=A0A5D3DVY3_CUCMM|nr:uncharacterized protein E5676_scaffold93G00260 [Cucumis melo var. makuwa]
MATRILELEAELMKHKRVPEVATKGETDESKIKSQMASKSIDTSDDANDHDAKEENRQVLEDLTIEDLTIEKQDKVGDENKYVCASVETLTKVKDGTSCRLAIGTKDNVAGAGTIFDYDMDGDNVKVSVDMVTDGKVSVVIPLDEKSLESGTPELACPRTCATCAPVGTSWSLVILKGIPNTLGLIKVGLGLELVGQIPSSPSSYLRLKGSLVAQLAWLEREQKPAGNSIGKLGSRMLMQGQTVYDRRRVAHECWHRRRRLTVGGARLTNAWLTRRAAKLQCRRARVWLDAKGEWLGSASGDSGLADVRSRLRARETAWRRNVVLGHGLQEECDARQLFRLGAGRRRSAALGHGLQEECDARQVFRLGAGREARVGGGLGLGAFEISNKKKPVWRIIKCPKQGGIVECGYYVMRFMCDIILSSNRTIIEVHRCLWNGGGKSMFRFINDRGSGERDGGSAKFMFKLNFDFRRGEGVGN